MKPTRWHRVLVLAIAGGMGFLLSISWLLGAAGSEIAQAQSVGEPQQNVTPAPTRGTPDIPTEEPTDLPERPTISVPTSTSTRTPPQQASATPTRTSAAPSATPTRPTATATRVPVSPSPTLGSNETALPGRPTVTNPSATPTTEPPPATPTATSEDEPPPESSATPTATDEPGRPTATSRPSDGGGGGGGGGGGDDDDDDDDDDDGDTGSGSGRITGTVIDLTTGAPVPGIKVRVGDVIVVTDANGNYERGGLEAGTYPVELVLEPGQGNPSQNVLEVTVAEGATVVQHLTFASPAAVSLAATPPTVDLIARLMPGAIGASGMKPIIIPRRLPATAGEIAPAAPWRWPVAGVALVVAGAGIYATGRRKR